MKAGKLDRTITLQAPSYGIPDDYGAVVTTWGDPITVRAELVAIASDEAVKDSGEAATKAITFRIRYVDGITTAHRLSYAGSYFNVRDIREIGRREALEVLAERSNL